MLSLALMLVAQVVEAPGARVGFELQEIGEVTPSEASMLIDELARAVEREAKATVLIQARPDLSCPIESSRCVELMPNLIEAQLELRLFGGLSVVRVEVTRMGTKLSTLRDSSDVPRDVDGARAALGELARRLFPTRLDPAIVAVDPGPRGTIEAVVVPPPEDAGLRPWLYGALGAAAVAGAVGIAFGVSSQSARSGAEEPGVPAARFDELADRAQSHGWAANILLGTAGVGLVTGVVLFVVDR